MDPRACSPPGSTQNVGTAPRGTIPSQNVRYRQGELGSLCSSDARALQGKRVRVLGSKDRPSCKRSEEPLGYLQRSIGSHSKPPEFSAKNFAAYCESKIGSVRADTAGSPVRSFRRPFIAWPH